jgi:hypothetical protein
VLREQRDYLEHLAGEIEHLHGAGLSVDAIVCAVFGGEPKVPRTETTWREMSGGEFSSRRWVKAFLRHPATVIDQTHG